jgi:hypothetical protein
MKLGDKLSVGALAVSALALFSSIFLAVFVLFSQQNFDLQVAEVDEIKSLRTEIISLIENEAKCFSPGDLTDLEGNYCQDFKQKNEPLAIAAKIRLKIYKKIYLFDDEFTKIVSMNGELKPFSLGSENSFELDNEEFMSYINGIILALDKEIYNRRLKLNTSVL